MRFCKSTFLLVFALLLAVFAGCAKRPAVQKFEVPGPSLTVESTREPNQVTVVHVIVALCDNKNQGIVPVSESLGDGERPDTNLYWGAAYGARTFFDKSPKWEKLGTLDPPSKQVLERVGYQHRKTGTVLIADAYRGYEIKKSMVDFFSAAAGKNIETVEIKGKKLQIHGGADVLAYVGHNGLMDFDLEAVEPDVNAGNRDAIMLACFSKKYFSRMIDDSTVRPLVWTTNLMAPEAYILHDALEARLAGSDANTVRMASARAYSRYQRISQKAAEGLLVTGW